MIQIRYTEPNLYRCQALRLTPGINEIREQDWDPVKDHPLVQKRIQTGQIVLLKASQEIEKSSSDPAMQKITGKAVKMTSDKTETLSL